MGMARGGGVRLLVLLLLGLACSNGGRCSGARTTRLPEQEGEARVSTRPEMRFFSSPCLQFPELCSCSRIYHCCTFFFRPVKTPRLCRLSYAYLESYSWNNA